MLLIPNNPKERTKSEWLTIKTYSEKDARELAKAYKSNCDVKLYTQQQVIDYGKTSLLTDALKETKVDYNEIFNLKNHKIDVSGLAQNLYQLDNKILVKYILFLSLHNIKLQREIGFNVEGESGDYQQAILLLFTKLADCLDMIDEILDDNLDCKHHIDSILDYLKYIMIAVDIPLFKSVRYLLNTHIRVLFNQTKELKGKGFLNQ